MKHDVYNSYACTPRHSPLENHFDVFNNAKLRKKVIFHLELKKVQEDASVLPDELDACKIHQTDGRLPELRVLEEEVEVIFSPR